MSSIPLSDEYFFTLAAFKCVFFLLGTVGNVLVLMYHAFVNRDKNPTSYFVSNLALADLVVCLTMYPIGIANIVFLIYGIEGLPNLLCMAAYLCRALSVALSALALLAVTYDRYVFIVHPLHYSSIMTSKKTSMILACVWILSLPTIPVSLLTQGLKRETGGICEKAPWGEVWLILAFADLPLILIVFLNMKIFKAAREQMKRIDRDCFSRANTSGTRGNVKKMKALKTFACIVGVLLCCYVPFSVMVFVEHFVCNACVPAIVHCVLLELLGINSIVNPYIYALRHRQHRKGYARILAVFFTCRFTG